MPGGNRKGPEGEGPKTGRALGLCSGNDKPGFTAQSESPGMGRRFRIRQENTPNETPLNQDDTLGRGQGGAGFGLGRGNAGRAGRGGGRGRGLGRGRGRQ